MKKSRFIKEIKNLQDIFECQKRFQEDLYSINFDTLSISQRIKILKDYAVGLLTEIAEVFQLLPYKFWRKQRSVKINKEHLKEELIDVFIYVINLFVLFGFSENDLFTEYSKKYNKILKRFLGKKKNDSAK
jgi:NTP pyrophosphatase (non-canonical NTP hydrolase)